MFKIQKAFNANSETSTIWWKTFFGGNLLQNGLLTNGLDFIDRNLDTEDNLCRVTLPMCIPNQLRGRLLRWVLCSLSFLTLFSTWIFLNGRCCTSRDKPHIVISFQGEMSWLAFFGGIGHLMKWDLDFGTFGPLGFHQTANGLEVPVEQDLTRPQLGKWVVCCLV